MAYDDGCEIYFSFTCMQSKMKCKIKALVSSQEPTLSS